MGITVTSQDLMLSSFESEINPHPIWNDDFYADFNKRFKEYIEEFDLYVGDNIEINKGYFDLEVIMECFAFEAFEEYAYKEIVKEYDNDPSRVDDDIFEDAKSEGWEIEDPSDIFGFIANQTAGEEYYLFLRELGMYLALQKYTTLAYGVYINSPQISLFVPNITSNYEDQDIIHYVDPETKEHICFQTYLDIDHYYDSKSHKSERSIKKEMLISADFSRTASISDTRQVINIVNDTRFIQQYTMFG